MEKTFQIKTNHGNLGYSYDYFTATEEYEKKAAECATSELIKTRENERHDLFFSFKGPRKAAKTLTVAEYDNNTHKLVKGGMKFKLKLCYIQTTYRGGNKVRKEWYEAVK